VLYFRACPRCELGTVDAKEDWDGYYFLCLNCGFVLECNPASMTSAHVVEEQRNLVTVA